VKLLSPRPPSIIFHKVATKTSPEVAKAAKASPRALRRLRTACEKAKRALSTAASAPLEVDNFQPDVDVNLVSKNRTPGRMRG
jgi:molecular chaperone DnaK (HSP70)